jgi:hypothetical protein
MARLLRRARGRDGRERPSGTKAKWLWEVKAVERPPGARNSGQRTTALAARRAADDYWSRWLEAAALKPDIERLAELS